MKALALLLLLPTLAQAQAIDVDVTPPVNSSDAGGAIAGIGLNLALGALRGPPKLVMRDADIPQASTRDVLFLIDPATDAAALAATGGVDVVEQLPLSSVNLIMVVAALRKGDTPAAAILRLGAVAGVLWAQPNHIYQLMGKTRKALPQRFALHHLPDTPVSGVIALIDTAVATGHDALHGATIRQAAGGAPGIHGTAIASLLVGTGQVPGVARGAQLLSFPAFTEGKSGPALAQSRVLARAFDAAILAQPAVLNLSFGGPDDRLLAHLLDAAQAKRICVAAAGGNGGKHGLIPFPASHAASLAVTAVDESLRIYAQATPGARLDVAAVGVNLLAAGTKGYRQVSGTSFATAVAAGALLRLPGCRAEALAKARDLGAPGRDAVFGAGLLQLGD
jgi:Subtilase family